MQEIGEVLSGSQWQIIIRNMLWTKPFRCQAVDMLCFFGIVHDSWVLTFDVTINWALHCSGSRFTYFLYSRDDLFHCIFFIGSYSALHESFVRENIERRSTTDIADREYTVWSIGNISGLYGVERIEDLDRTSYGVDQFVWGWSMTTLSFDLDTNNTNVCKERSFLNPDVTLIKIWHIV